VGGLKLVYVDGVGAEFMYPMDRGIQDGMDTIPLAGSRWVNFGAVWFGH
jgi:hypothetical protein